MPNKNTTKAKPNVLITGGSGFVGTHLIRYLQKHKLKNITVIDLTSPKVKGIKFIKSDFNKTNILASALKDKDYVFHLAAVVGVDKSRLNPKKVHRINNTNTKKFINLCAKMDVKRFIFSSSSEVYGNSKNIPFKENSKLSPVSEYGRSKIEVEQYLKKVQNKFKKGIGIVRFFNAYGPGQRKDFVVSKFIDNAGSGKAIKIFGDGKQTRCFTYVNDAVEGLYRVSKYNKTRYEIFNIGSNQEHTINELAKIVLKNIPDTKSKVLYIKYGNGQRNYRLEIKRRVPAVDKAFKLLGFKAKTTLKRGVKQIIEDLS